MKNKNLIIGIIVAVVVAIVVAAAIIFTIISKHLQQMEKVKQVSLT